MAIYCSLYSGHTVGAQVTATGDPYTYIYPNIGWVYGMSYGASTGGNGQVNVSWGVDGLQASVSDGGDFSYSYSCSAKWPIS